MAGFQFAGAELDMTESTVGDAFVEILHVFLCPLTEVKVSDSFFRIPMIWNFHFVPLR